MNTAYLNILLLLGSLQALLMALYFLLVSKLRGARYFGALMVMLALHLFIMANDNPAFFHALPHLLHVAWFIPAMYGPLILIFVRRITGVAVSRHKSEALYFLPLLIIMTAHSAFFFQSAADKQAYLLDTVRWHADDFSWFPAAAMWILLAHFMLAIRVLAHYRRVLPVDMPVLARLGWLRNFVLFSAIILAWGLIDFYACKYQLPVLGALYPSHFVGVMVLIYWSAFKLINQPLMFQEVPAAAQKRESPAEPKLANDQHQELAGRLQVLLEQERIYLTPALSLADLVARLESNKQYVSETINLVYGKNFYDFINEYRLNEFIEQMLSPANSHLTMLGVAYQSGFNSKATFNAVFKKHFGVSPSEYFKKISNKKSELVNSDD